VAQQLFPDMPLPELLATNGAAQGLDPGGTSGVMPGLDAALLDRLRNYQPGDIGICELADKLQLTLAVPDWGTYHFHATGISATVTGGESENAELYTVPMDRRAWLHGVTLTRASGDNTFSRIMVRFEDGYYAGGSELQLKRLVTAGTSCIWPDPGEIQPLTHLQQAPMLLEPGTRIMSLWSGAGVSDSTMNYEIDMTMTKLVRQVVP